MFIIDQSPTYSYPVTFEVTAEDGSRTAQSFDAVFHRIDSERIEAIFKQAEEQRQPDAMVARQLLAGWRGITTSTGADLPYTEANIKRVLATPRLPAAVIAAFWASLPGAAEKN